MFESFNPLDRVKFVQILNKSGMWCIYNLDGFQSPRSGQICSNYREAHEQAEKLASRFNPLDRVKFVQIVIMEYLLTFIFLVSIPQIGSNLFKFNTLEELKTYVLNGFQSPRSGQICSNYAKSGRIANTARQTVVSIPQIGSNLFKFRLYGGRGGQSFSVSIPQIGSNLFKFNSRKEMVCLSQFVSIPQIGSNLFKYTNLRKGRLYTTWFQSPRSGQICSNSTSRSKSLTCALAFQSPRSGQICSNQEYCENISLRKG